MSIQAVHATSYKPMYWLALGAFAIGTEGFMIAPLLPDIASEFSVSVGTAGQLVTFFALAYALSSPVLTALTGAFNRRRLLIFALAAFSLANLLAWAASSYWMLMLARVLLAFSAGLYLPGANAVAGALVPPEQRGKTIAIVSGGLTLAITLGVPLGAMLGASAGWRSTFACVAVIAACATIGLVWGLPRGFGDHLPTASLKQRLSVARMPAVLLALLTATLWSMGTYVVYTFLALYLEASTAVTPAFVSGILFSWGIASAAGLYLGGRWTDRFGAASVQAPALFVMTLAFLAMSVIPLTLTKTTALVPVLLAVCAWGAAAWAFNPAQQARLMSLAGVSVGSVALSLNASFMYVGFSMGAALGGLTITHASTLELGYVAALCSASALVLLLSTRKLRVPVAVPA